MYPQTLFGLIPVPAQEEKPKRPWTRGEEMEARCHTATVDPLLSLGGHGPGDSGIWPNANPCSLQFHSALYSLRESLLLSHPTLSCCT